MAALRRGVGAGLAVAAVVLLIVLLTQGSSSRRSQTAPPKSSTSVTSPRSTSTAPPAPVRSIDLGANVGSLFNGQAYGPSEIAAQLTALSATGAAVARADAPWEASEPRPPAGGVHSYDWSFDDAVAAALAAHHLRWLPVIDYSAPWAQSLPGQDHSAPTSDADYAAYAAAVARRYGVGGGFWGSHPELAPLPVDTYEIWNEPDSGVFWSPRPDPGQYAGLYLAARAAIHAVQPNARVIVGGLAHASTFIPELVAASPQLGAQLDGVAIHPYGPDPQAVVGSVRSARAALSAAGLGGVPLYVTEFGWATSPPGGPHYLPETLRPAYIELALAALGHLDCGVTAVLLYAWITPERNPSDSNDWFGISPPGGGDTSDTRAFVAGLRAAAAPGAAVPCS